LAAAIDTIAAGTSAPIPTAAKAMPTNHEGKAMEEECRHGEVVAELLEAGRIFGKLADACSNGEEADERKQTE